MKLSEQQEEIIKNYIEAQGFKLKSLEDELIDHLCCEIENGFEEGKSFEDLFNEAIQDLALSGLQEIENTTIFLLHTKRELSAQ